MERLGGWGGIGELAGASLLGFGGNMLGTYLGGSISSALGLTDEEPIDPTDDARKLLALKNEALVNTNAMGQRGRQASIGAKIAQDSFRPDTGAVFDKAQAGGIADLMLSSAQQQNRSARQVQAQQAGNMQQQMMDAASQSGGSPAAMMAIARQGGEAASQGAAGLLGQMGANTQQALSSAAGTRGNASQIFNNALSQQYQRDVVPYMNDYKDMSGLAITGYQGGVMKRTERNRSNSETKEGMSIDPLGYLNSAIGQSLGMQSTERNLGGGMQDDVQNSSFISPLETQGQGSFWAQQMTGQIPPKDFDYDAWLQSVNGSKVFNDRKKSIFSR